MASRVGSCARFAGLLVAALIAAKGAVDSDSSRWLDVEFPRDSPVLPLSFSLAPSTSRVRGASIALDLHASLVLRNTSSKAISGLTLRVAAQDLVPPGTGSVTVPSLDVQPGEAFPVRIDLQLLRPFSANRPEGAMVRVSLDCAVFGDLSSYGPDRLQSRRSLVVYELQARRDRHYMAELLRAGRYAQLREELNFGMPEFHPQQLGLEMLRGLQPAAKPDLSVAVNTMDFPSSPIRATSGNANVAGNEVRTPRIEIKNSSQKSVRSVDMGWIVRDERGRDFVAGSLPADLPLQPVQTGTITETGTLRFSSPAGQPMAIGSLITFVNDVEFADGKLWIPSRSDIEEATADPWLRRALTSSPEQQRLSQVFRRKGLRALADELKRPN